MASQWAENTSYGYSVRATGKTAFYFTRPAKTTVYVEKVVLSPLSKARVDRIRRRACSFSAAQCRTPTSTCLSSPFPRRCGAAASSARSAPARSSTASASRFSRSPGRPLKAPAPSSRPPPACPPARHPLRRASSRSGRRRRHRCRAQGARRQRPRISRRSNNGVGGFRRRRRAGGCRRRRGVRRRRRARRRGHLARAVAQRARGHRARLGVRGLGAPPRMPRTPPPRRRATWRTPRRRITRRRIAGTPRRRW